MPDPISHQMHFLSAETARSSEQTILVKAYAKINLGLEVLRKRTDGYHDINTIFARIGLHDTLEITPQEETTIRLFCTPSLDIPHNENLVWKVATALQKHIPSSNLYHGADIFLTKHIPTGAGLGGGSSDAAYTLMTLAQCWNITSREILHAIAAQHGSDIPFFLLNTMCALGTSRGETLTPLPTPREFSQLYLVLCFPGISVSTPRAYSAIQRTHERPATDLSVLLQNPQNLFRSMVNDFELPVFTEFPLLAELQKSLEHHGAFRSWMSGSGSTIVGIFDNTKTAHDCAGSIQEKYQIKTHLTVFA